MTFTLLLLGLLGLAGTGRFNLALVILIFLGTLVWSSAALAPEREPEPDPVPPPAGEAPQGLLA